MSIRTRTDRHGRKSHQVRLPGERARTFRSHKAAEDYEAKRRDLRASGEREKAPPITLAEALEDAISRWVVTSRPAPASESAARARAAFWTKAGLGGMRLDLLDAAFCEDVIVARAKIARTAARFELQWFKRALKDAQRRRQVFDPALLSIPAVRNDEEREGIALTVDELQLLGSWFPPYLARLPEILGSVGFRITEALRLTDDRIDLEAGTVFIPKPKEKRPKLIELADFERQLIAEQLIARPAGSRYLFPSPSGAALSYSNFYARIWCRATRAASREFRELEGLPLGSGTKFDLLRPHDLRHTAISAMAAGGMRPEVIAKRVGHADGGKLVLTRYRHLFPDEMGDQLAGYAARRSTRLAVAVGS